MGCWGMKSEVWPCWFSVRCWACEEMFYLSFFFFGEKENKSMFKMCDAIFTSEKKKMIKLPCFF